MTLGNNTGLYINIFLILVLVFSVFRGYRKGFIIQVIGFFSLILAAVVAWILYPSFGKLFQILPNSMAPFQTTNLKDFFYLKTNSILWFIILFFVALILIKFIAKVLDLISRAPILNFINRVLGVGFSLINVLLISGLLVFGLSLPLFTNGQDVIEDSVLKYNENVVNKITGVIKSPIKQLQSVQEVIKKPKQAKANDVENMQEWLLNNKVALEDVMKFFKEIKDE